MFDDAEPPAAREGVSATAGREPPAAIDPADYDVGPDCPRDELYARLNAARLRQRLDPPVLGPIRWLI